METSDFLSVPFRIEGMDSHYYENTLDLTGIVLQITTRFNGDYEYDVSVRNISKPNGQVEYELVGGYAVDTLLYLQSLLNFTYQIRPDVQIYEFDYNQLKNESKPHIDLYAASYSLLQRRTYYLDPTFVIGESRIVAFLDHKYETDSNKQSIFLAPFTMDLWFALVLVFVASFATLAILSFYERRVNLGDVVLQFIGVMLQRGWYINFPFNSIKITIVTLAITMIIVGGTYTGILTSFSAIHRFSINSIETLLQSDYKIMLELGYNDNSSAIKAMLEALAHIPAVKIFLEKSKESGFAFKSFEQSIKEVRRSPATYIIDEETGSDEISKQIGGFPCGWGKISVFDLSYPWVMYVRKKAPFKEELNIGILRMHERGMFQVFRKRWISKPSENSCKSRPGKRPIPFQRVRLPQLTDLFKLLLPIMLVVCPVILLLECGDILIFIAAL
ncbi:unnamed protein product [Orchesella dallaii]|uniref:Uncharacterized protein n=1 Tax=Orchesella dallaii TaxID=48710 RepID=A0ABP1RQ30_9HEXA